MRFRSPKIGIICLATIAATLPTATVYAGSVIHVDADAAGPLHNGTSWCTAYLSLHEALDSANTGTIIRVADGVYTPDPTGLADPREATFRLMNGVTIEGGYPGCGANDPDERDIEAYATILSGDLDGDDDQGEPVPGGDCCSAHSGPGCDDADCYASVCDTYSSCCGGDWREFCAGIAAVRCCDHCGKNVNACENAYHIMSECNLHTDTIVDGLTFRAGNANIVPDNSHGGGMHLINASPTIRNCLFAGNTSLGGAAVYSQTGDPTFVACTFRDNLAVWTAGISTGSGHATLVDCTFIGNSSRSTGGAFSAYGSATLIDCIFAGNTAHSGGGAYFILGHSVLQGCTFVGNSALVGGAIGMVGGTQNILNCTFVNNEASIQAGAINNGGDTTLTNCSFVGNSAAVGGGGAIDNFTNMALTNCTFSANRTSRHGGAIRNSGYLTATNCTLVGNLAEESGGGLFGNGDSALTVTNSILWGNIDSGGMDESAQIHLGAPGAPEAFVESSCIQGWTGALGGTGNIGDDPLLGRADGTDDIGETERNDLRLSPCSPAVDAGDNLGVAADVFDLDDDGDTDEPIPVDLDGNLRIVGAVVDMGAYEYQGGADSDGDGLFDDCDACPRSDLEEGLIVRGCDSNVENILFDDGCTMADRIAECDARNGNHGRYVRCIGSVAHEWVRDGVISGRQRGRIVSCAATENGAHTRGHRGTVNPPPVPVAEPGS